MTPHVTDQGASNDSEMMATAEAVLRQAMLLPYEPPMCTCAYPGCDVQTTGVFCPSCALR